MSSIYNLEPQPTASAIIHTTQGEIAVELFARQTPLTCRNFLQLALDGYYDNTEFHRLVPGFILQGGDPTSTGHGGESIYDNGALSGDLDPWPMDQRRGQNAGTAGVGFKDEFHSRLKFSRRGLLGSANEGIPDSNGSQFFFTLGKTEELSNKNTLFGRVAGDTIYNLAKMGEGDVQEGSDRPLYPVKITHIEILINPFEDVKKRQRVAVRQIVPAEPATKKTKKRKGGKQLLSFIDDEEEIDELPLIKKPKVHARSLAEDESKLQKDMPLRAATKKNGKLLAQDQEARPGRGDEARESSRIQSSRPVERGEPTETASVKSPSRGGTTPEVEARQKTLLERTNEEFAALKASLRRNIQSEPAGEKKKTSLEQLIPESAIRGRKRGLGASSVHPREEQDVLNILKAFKSKLEKAPEEKQSFSRTVVPDAEGIKRAIDVGEGEDDVCDLHFIESCQSCRAWDKREADDNSDDEGWMSHKLTFAADKLGKDLNYRKKAEEDLIVIDPLEKARTLMEEKKMTKNRGVAKPGGAWDRGQKA